MFATREAPALVLGSVLVLLLAGLAYPAGAQPDSLQERARAAAALREEVIAEAIAVLEEGPAVHPCERIAASIGALQDLRAGSVFAIRQLVRYLDYPLRDPNAIREYPGLEATLAEPSAMRALIAIGPQSTPYVIAQIGAGACDADGELMCATIIKILLGELANKHLVVAVANTSDSDAAERIEAFRKKYLGFFTGPRGFAPVRPVRPVN